MITKIHEVKLNDLVKFDGKLYIVAESKWQNKSSWNDKDGKGSGFRLMLRKVRIEELTEMVIKSEGGKK